MVYFPLATPSKTSRSSWEIHCGQNESHVRMGPRCDVRSLKTHSVGEVHFHGEDTNILGAGLRGMGSDAVCVDTICVGTVCVDTVDGRHFERERDREEGRMRGRMREKERSGDEVL